MESLTKGLGGRDGHFPFKLWAVLALWVGLETRVKAAVHLLARVVKGGLGDSVVLLLEDELDDVALCGRDRLGVVSQEWHVAGSGRLQTSNSNL